MLCKNCWEFVLSRFTKKLPCRKPIKCFQQNQDAIERSPKPILCGIQWVDPKTKMAAPDMNPAIARVRYTQSKLPLASVPICAEHRAQLDRHPGWVLSV